MYLLTGLVLTLFFLLKKRGTPERELENSKTDRRGILAICSKAAARFASWKTSCRGSLDVCFCSAILAQPYST